MILMGCSACIGSTFLRLILSFIAPIFLYHCSHPELLSSIPDFYNSSSWRKWLKQVPEVLQTALASRTNLDLYTDESHGPKLFEKSAVIRSKEDILTSEVSQLTSFRCVIHDLCVRSNSQKVNSCLVNDRFVPCPFSEWK